MKSETLRQIEKNKRAYYSNMSQLKNYSTNISEPAENDLNQIENTDYDFKKIIQFTLNKFSFKPNFNNLFTSQFGKKVGQLVKNGNTKLDQFNNGIKKTINTKSDQVIERFYQFGASIFEVNDVQNNNLQLEAIPIYSIDKESKIENAFQVSNIPFFKPFNNILRNIIIYLESDSFTFSGVKSSNVIDNSMVLNYQTKIQTIKNTITFSTVKQATVKKMSFTKTHKKNIVENTYKSGQTRFLTKNMISEIMNFIHSSIHRSYKILSKGKRILFKPISKIQIETQV